MAFAENWEQDFEKEIMHARAALEAGNDGMARVCARRAAGIAVGVHLTQIGAYSPRHAFYNNLKTFLHHPQTPTKLKAMAENFLIHVNKDHSLPVDVDLTHEAIKLKTELNKLRI